MTDREWVIAKPDMNGRGRRYFRGLGYQGVVWESTYLLHRAATYATREEAIAVLTAAQKQHEGWQILERG
jgi:hypothetical protein